MTRTTCDPLRRHADDADSTSVPADMTFDAEHDRGATRAAAVTSASMSRLKHDRRRASGHRQP